MCQNSCQPEGLQPESALAALLVLAIERLLPSPGALPSPILAATHTCLIMLRTLKALRAESFDIDLRLLPDDESGNQFPGGRCAAHADVTMAERVERIGVAR